MGLRAVGRMVVAVSVGATLVALGSPAHAVEFDRRLKGGMSGRDVKALQVRLAGWYPNAKQKRFVIDGEFGTQTAKAIESFETHYGFDNPDGVAGDQTFKVIARLTDRDGSTAHFSYGEFKQHESSSCSAQANAYAGSFGGGPVAKKRVKRNVRRLMWRLEAVRAKSGGGPVGINSGFRSLPYNSCIGGASVSQHLFGTAADNRVGGISNDKARSIARRSQVHGIACYSNTTHNHFDLRYENPALPSAQSWWWPSVDSEGRELDETGRPCWGEGTARSASAGLLTAAPELDSLVPTAAEVRAFAEAGEPADLEGAE